jgi:prolipoprotein diacylglyceryltransferase
MDNQNGDSGVNTVLIVIVLLIIVGAAVWYFSMRWVTPTQPSTPKVNVDVTLPTSPTGTGL